MKIVVAPDSFKGTLSANEVAVIIKDSFLRVFDDKNLDAIIDIAPIADGGEGTSTVLLENLGGVRKHKTVTGPEFEAVDAFYSILDHSVAVIEVAETSGLKQCQSLDTKRTTSYGLGELILDALDHNVNEIILCLGGSGTTDGGIGMASALGVSFLMDDETPVYPTGENLYKINSISTTNIDPRIASTTFTILSDVNNPLFGLNGAAHIYGPQKGATKNDVLNLDIGLHHYAEKLYQTLHKDCSSFPGAGAAGGLGAASFAFLDAQVVPGIEKLLNLIEFDKTILDADLIITGEGRLDKQSFMGKAISGIITHAREIPVLIICGDNSCDENCEEAANINIFAATDYYSKKMSLKNPIESLKKVSEECAKFIIETGIKEI